MGDIDSVGRVRDMGWRGEELKPASAECLSCHDADAFQLSSCLL
jgi:hypothetical protein